MAVKVKEAGKRISAANAAKIRTVLDTLNNLLQSQEEGAQQITEAALQIGKVESLADVQKTLKQLVAYIPSAIAREQIEGDGDGDLNDEDNDHDDDPPVQGMVGQTVTSESLREAVDNISYELTLLEKDYDTATRVTFAKKGWAIPVKNDKGEIINGKYPIANSEDLNDAKRRIGSGKGSKTEIVNHINKRASDLGGKKVGETDTKEAGISCASCGEPVARYDDYCRNCGEGLMSGSGSAMAHCVGCGATLGSDDKFCPGCGKETGISMDADAKLAKSKESKHPNWWLREAMKSHDGSDDAFKAMSASQQRQHMIQQHGVDEDSPNIRIPARRFAKHSADHSGVKESAGKVEDFEIDEGFIPIKESFIGKDGKLTIKLISPGWGTSGYYSKDMLQREAHKFPTGHKMYWNHPTEDEDRQRPERDLRDLAAVTESAAQYLDSGPDGPGLYASAKPVSTYASAIEELAPHIGVSINAVGRGRKGEAEGKKGPIIESIVKSRSTDFVTEPGAGGKITQLFESAFKRHTPLNTEVEDEVELQEAMSKNKDLQQENDRLRERIVMREAKDMALTELEKEDTLPPIVIRRLAENLSHDPPIDEFGELDRREFKRKINEGVRDEAKYLDGIARTGRVRGLGRSTGEFDDDDDDDLFESGRSSRRRHNDDDGEESDEDGESSFTTGLSRQLQRIGLSESISKKAAVGRS